MPRNAAAISTLSCPPWGATRTAAGVSRSVIDQAFAGVTIDQAVLAFDRRQRGMFHARASRNMPPPASSRRASSAPSG